MRRSKELVGAFKNGGRKWRPTGEPEPIKVYDFRTQAPGRAMPYGGYDVTANRGLVSVGMEHDTAELVRFQHRYENSQGVPRQARSEAVFQEVVEGVALCTVGGGNG